ncbi:MAG: hypothetical protein Tsb006_8170 [Rickettsiaceae bacterium]
MSKILSTSIPITTSHTNNSCTQFASSNLGQYMAPELVELVNRVQTWRDHKTFRGQPMPHELKFSIAKLLSSGLCSRAALVKQLDISYNKLTNIEASFADHKDLNTNQPVDLNFVPFKLVPHNQTINSDPDSNSTDNKQLNEHLNTTIQERQHITDSIPVTQIKNIMIHKADGANLTERSPQNCVT